MTWLQSVATLVCAAGLAVFYYLMELHPQSPKKIPTEGKEFRMPDSRFHYTPDALYGLLNQAGDHLPRLRRYWLLDFGLIVCFWGVMIAIGLNVAGRGTALFLPMGILATARALLDIAENLLLLRLCRRYPQRGDRLAALAGLATAAKFICLYAWVALLFVKLFAAAFGIVGLS